MQSPTLYSSTPNDERKFVIKRIDAEDIEINNTERMTLLKAMNGGVKYIQVRDYTLMINAIKSIDPVRERKQSYPIDFDLRYELPELDLTIKDKNSRRQQIAEIKNNLRKITHEN
jgi:hypothetical protein